MDLFKLVATLGLDTSEFEQGVSKSRGLFGNLGSTVSAGTIAMGHLMADAVKKGADMVVSLGKTGISYNAQMEDYASSFKVMLGSTEAAAERVENLKVMAAKTPFEMSDLAAATQTLLAFGIEADKTDGIMKMLGDVSLGNSQKFSSLATVFGQVSSTGKLMGQDLLQFINTGFNPLQVIAEKTGASMGDLKNVMSGDKTSREFRNMVKAAQKEVKKMGDGASDSAKLLAQIGKDGVISAEMVQKAFEIATSEGGQFFNGMEEASKTFNGQISTLTDNVNGLIGKAFEPLSNMLTSKILPGAINVVDTLSNAFDEGGFSGMARAAGDMLKGLVGKIKIDFPTWDELSATATAWWATTKTKMDELTAWALGKFEPPTLEEVTASVGTWWTGTARPAINNLLSWALGAFELPDIASITANISDWWSNQGGKESVMGMLDWALGTFALPAAEDIASLIGTWWTETARPSIDALLEWTLGTFTLPNLAELIASIGDWWTNQGGKESISEMLDWTLGKIVMPAIDEVISSVAAWWGMIKESVVEQLDWALGVFGFPTLEEIVAAVELWWSGIVDSINAVLQAKLGIKLPSISEVVNKIKSWWSGVLSSLGTLLFGVGPDAGGAGAGRSFAVGKDYVPYNNYAANLHRGEAVLTRSEAEDWRRGRGERPNITVIQNIYSEAKTAAELMEEARWAQERAVLGYV